jgi:hypothetical protein
MRRTAWSEAKRARIKAYLLLRTAVKRSEPKTGSVCWSAIYSWVETGKPTYGSTVSAVHPMPTPSFDVRLLPGSLSSIRGSPPFLSRYSGDDSCSPRDRNPEGCSTHRGRSHSQVVIVRDPFTGLHGLLRNHSGGYTPESEGSSSGYRDASRVAMRLRLPFRAILLSRQEMVAPPGGRGSLGTAATAAVLASDVSLLYSENTYRAET